MEPSSAYQAGEAIGRIIGFAIVGFLFLGGGVFFIVSLIKAFSRKTTAWIAAAIISGCLTLFGLLGAIGFAAKAIADRAITAKSNTEKKKRLSAATGDYSLMVPQSWK